MEETSARCSLAFLENYPASNQDFDAIKGSFETDINCSVRLDSDSFMAKVLIISTLATHAYSIFFPYIVVYEDVTVQMDGLT